MRRRHFVPAPRCLLAILIAAGACRDVPFFESPPPRSAHERYAARLAKAGLDSTTLGREWLAAAQRAIREPLTQSLPFRETGYISAAEARALAYRIDLREGQQISATAEASGGGLTLFLDLFRATGDSAEPLALVASTDSSLTRASSRLVHDVRRDGTYVLRLQPALLESGAFTLDVTTAPTLAFPVEGRDSRAVRSFFGAERDGGARDHHGIDIFAPRGTPALDAATGAWFRVRLPDGEAGYVPSRLVEQTARPLRRTDVAAGTPLRDRPAADAAVVTTADGGAMPVIGTFADYALVETAAGRTAWVASGGLK